MTLLLIEIRKLESRMLKNFSFQIKRTHSSGYEIITIPAMDETLAINLLPQCVTWDFYKGF